MKTSFFKNKKIKTNQSNTIPLIENYSKWYKTDTTWMFSLYGTAIGTGVLFLPINIGTGGIIPMLVIAVLAYPITYFSHLGLTRFVLSSKNSEDITGAISELFGKGTGKMIALLYFFSIYSILLIYGVAITNTVESFMINQLQITPPARSILSLILIISMMLIIFFGKKIIVKAISILVLPFISALMVLALYLVPQWNKSAFETFTLSKVSIADNSFLMTLWLSIPIIIFSFNHAPIISSFVVAKREEYGIFVEKKCATILSRAHIVMVVTVMFFVFSCILSLSPEDLVSAKKQNISILSFLANYFRDPIIDWTSPIIAMIAIIKSFLGHYLGVCEGFNRLLIKSSLFMRYSTNKIVILKKLNQVTVFFILISTWVVATLNPNILKIIANLIGPIIAMILFLLPIYATRRVSTMRKYKGNISNFFIMIIGLIAVSSIFYSIFN